jgi:arylsulfatase A-like enzyme
MASCNLLFVFTDEHRRDGVGAYWNRPGGDAPESMADPAPDVRTPHLDRLAAEGVRFSRAYANSPVCTPCRGTLLTGQWPHVHGALANDLPVNPASPSIARALGDVGYACAYVGKWHLGGIPRWRFIPPGPERLGFDSFWAAWNCSHDYFYPLYHLDTPSPVTAPGRYEPEVQTDLALGWLGRHRAESPEQPFCLFVSYGPPHTPYRPLPPGTEGLYDPAALQLRPNCADTPEIRQDLADHYAHITALDAQIGRLLDDLRDAGELDQTLVVFSSDHGTMIGCHGVRFKQWPYEEAAGVPLLMRCPALLGTAGRVDDRLIGVVDYAPTLLGLLGVDVPEAMQGRDLSAVVGSTMPPSTGDHLGSIYFQEAAATDQFAKQGGVPWRGVRTDRYTYARTIHEPWMLFDNHKDPWQLRNLVDEPAARALREEMDRELAAWMERTGDALLPTEEVMARFGLAEAWAERQEFMHRPGSMGGRPPELRAVG